MTEPTENEPQMVEVRQVALIHIDRRVWYAVLACFLSCVLMCAASLAFAVHVARQEGRNFCELLGTYDQVYRDNPPQTETGRTLAVEITRLVNRLDCND